MLFCPSPDTKTTSYLDIPPQLLPFQSTLLPSHLHHQETAPYHTPLKPAPTESCISSRRHSHTLQPRNPHLLHKLQGIPFPPCILLFWIAIKTISIASLRVAKRIATTFHKHQSFRRIINLNHHSPANLLPCPPKNHVSTHPTTTTTSPITTYNRYSNKPPCCSSSAFISIYTNSAETSISTSKKERLEASKSAESAISCKQFPYGGCSSE